MAEDKSSGLGDGIRTGIGILTAFKEAIEETLDDAISRGDLSPERAKAVMKDTATRVQSSLEEARERLDVVSRKEFEALRREVEALRTRVHQMENRAQSGLVGAGDRPGEGPAAAGPGSASGTIPVD